MPIGDKIPIVILTYAPRIPFTCQNKNFLNDYLNHTREKTSSLKNSEAIATLKLIVCLYRLLNTYLVKQTIEKKEIILVIKNIDLYLHSTATLLYSRM